MHLTKLEIRNFRCFGDEPNHFELKMNAGLTALVGENDAGKTAVVDALRFALGTSDQERLWLDESDFHQDSREIRIICRFEGLSSEDMRAFVEYLTYGDGADCEPVLYVNWTAADTGATYRGRPYRRVEVHSGRDGDGPSVATETRELLRATYLRPLRDAQQALSAGHGSRLSQVLRHTDAVTSAGQPYDPDATLDAAALDALSVLGIGDLANALIQKHQGIGDARGRINAHLEKLALRAEEVTSSIDVSGARDSGVVRLRRLLEKLNLTLNGDGKLGLGSNNLLFMACELLLLAEEDVGSRLLLIEEPESHLDAQRQLRAMAFLQEQARDRGVQVIVTTHSPNLASAIDLDNIVMVRRNRVFSMARGQTQLSPSDYRFLQRFLDVTKANLFFARGVMIVEGDAENILLPTLAKLIDKDFAEYGVSIVNVGGVGLRRYARIFQRADVDDTDQDGQIAVPVACLTDMDVMPDCAPVIIGKLGDGDEWPSLGGARRWRAKRDFAADGELNTRRNTIASKADGQCVKTFISDEWTLEYDLALGPKDTEGSFTGGLTREVFMAAYLAGVDDAINGGQTTLSQAYTQALDEFSALEMAATDADGCAREEVLASQIYAKFAKDGVSKAVAAQYLAECLQYQARKGRLVPEKLRERLPTYLVQAIDYVTAVPDGTPESPDIAGASDG